MRELGMHESGSGWEKVAGCCEQNNETYGHTECGKFE